MLTQIPFVVAIVWLILKLVDKQTQMLDTITERHESSIKYIVERFEIMDDRRDNHNQVTVSALLAVLGEVGFEPPPLPDVTPPPSPSIRRSRSKTSTALLRTVEGDPDIPKRRKRTP